MVMQALDTLTIDVKTGNIDFSLTEKVDVIIMDSGVLRFLEFLMHGKSDLDVILDEHILLILLILILTVYIYSTRWRIGITTTSPMVVGKLIIKIRSILISRNSSDTIFYTEPNALGVGGTIHSMTSTHVQDVHLLPVVKILVLHLNLTYEYVNFCSSKSINFRCLRLY